MLGDLQGASPATQGFRVVLNAKPDTQNQLKGVGGGTPDC